MAFNEFFAQQLGSESGEAVAGLRPASNAASEQSQVATACVRAEAKSLASLGLLLVLHGCAWASWALGAWWGSASMFLCPRGTCLYGIYL